MTFKSIHEKKRDFKFLMQKWITEYASDCSQLESFTYLNKWFLFSLLSLWEEYAISLDKILLCGEAM